MIDLDKLRKRKIVLDTYIDTFCDLIGEGVNALIRKAISKVSDVRFDPNALVATVGAILGIYESGRVPRKYKCIDFVKAFNIKEGYDENYVYGKPSVECVSIREKRFLHTIEDIFGRSAKVVRKHIYDKIKDVNKVLKIATISRETDPRLIRYDISVKDDLVEVTLCYKDPSIVEALARLTYGGFNSGTAAYAIAKKYGYDDVEFVRGEKIDNECVKYVYRMIKRN